jgi:hypothetical protein
MVEKKFTKILSGCFDADIFGRFTGMGAAASR